LVYRIARITADLLLSLFTRREIIGLENVPQPPYILATNHLSIFDLPLLLTVCPHTIRAFVASKHKNNLLYAPFMAITGAVWVRRGKVDRKALRQALDVLERREVLGVAPEGTRARDARGLQKGKTGTAYLAARANVPIVPVGITGTESMSHDLPRLRRSRLRVTIGQPIRLPESGRIRGPKLEEYTDLVMRRIAELLPEAYRGVYASEGYRQPQDEAAGK
jgi:1-acyl-sn-glycerol-3-phosphate acyltransferase